MAVRYIINLWDAATHSNHLFLRRNYITRYQNIYYLHIDLFEKLISELLKARKKNT